MQHDNGIFWIDYDSLLQNFKGLYLNWNRDLFAHQTNIHEWWPSSQGPKNDQYNVGYNPQYHLTITVPLPSGKRQGRKSTAAVWILLSRHIVDKNSEETVKQYMSVHVWKSAGSATRLFYNRKPHASAPYSNCLLYTSPSPRDRTRSRMPSSA